MTPRTRVEALIVAARRVFGPGRAPTLVAALSEESGLHPRNVLWALDHALELSPEEDDLRRLYASAPTRSAVLVVLSANVLTAPLRAIAWALAQSERVLVRTSRRAGTFARALIDAVPGLGIELATTSDDPAADVQAAIQSLPPGAAVHAYGGAATMESVARLARGLAVELHGPGFGVIVDRPESLIANADAIARDVTAFDQGGCLSPRVVVTLGKATAVAEALHAALGRVGEDTTRRTLEPSELLALKQLRDAALYGGEALEGPEHLVVELDRSTLPPAARALCVTAAADVDDAVARVRALGPELSSIGTSLDEIAAAFPHVRVSPLGAMQRPPLDGPVDRRP